MAVTTIGQIMVNDALPEKYRDPTRVMDKDAADAVLARMATEDPQHYREVSHQLMQLGRHASFEEGSTLRLQDLISPSKTRKATIDFVSKKEREIELSDMSEADKREAKSLLFSEASESISEDTYKHGIINKNPFALQVKAKARGNKGQLVSLLSTPGTYANHKGDMVPVFIKRSYAEGLEPDEYWSAAHGGRVGVLSTKTGTAKGGYLGKLLSAASMEVVVTGADCATENGIPVKSNDPDNIGGVLARKTGPFSAGTVVTKQVMADLEKKGIEELVMRSPLACGQHQGVCQQCAGKRETGGFPPLGYNLGSVAASSMAEQVAQQALNTKHGGKKHQGRGFSGFEVIKNLVTSPETYPDRAAIASMDGVVDKIEAAPQGGTNVFINNEVHHVLPEMDVYAKIGDKVEAGDILSNGVANPADIVKYKGIGEGRRYLASRFTKAFRDSGLGINRRNVEAVTSAVVNHVNIEDDDADGDYLPGDTVRYSSWSKSYKPREDSVDMDVNSAHGKYLEAPAMHYTIGTRVTPSVASRLSAHGYTTVKANQRPPSALPAFKSVVKTPEFMDDWMARLGSSYLETRLIKDVQTGAESDAHSLNPIPGLAKTTEFGEPPKGSVSPY